MTEKILLKIIKPYMAKVAGAVKKIKVLPKEILKSLNQTVSIRPFTLRVVHPVYGLFQFALRSKADNFFRFHIIALAIQKCFQNIK